MFLSMNKRGYYDWGKIVVNLGSSFINQSFIRRGGKGVKGLVGDIIILASFEFHFIRKSGVTSKFDIYIFISNIHEGRG